MGEELVVLTANVALKGGIPLDVDRDAGRAEEGRDNETVSEKPPIGTTLMRKEVERL